MEMFACEIDLFLFILLSHRMSYFKRIWPFAKLGLNPKARPPFRTFPTKTYTRKYGVTKSTRAITSSTITSIMALPVTTKIAYSTTAKEPNKIFYDSYFKEHFNSKIDDSYWNDQDLFTAMYGKNIDLKKYSESQIRDLNRAGIIISIVFGLGPVPKDLTEDELSLIHTAAKMMSENDPSLGFAMVITLGTILGANPHLQ
jgi:hypothetical protein